MYKQYTLNIHIAHIHKCTTHTHTLQMHTTDTDRQTDTQILTVNKLWAPCLTVGAIVSSTKAFTLAMSTMFSHIGN